ncbi:MAG: Uncharacterised protein [Pseudidiomarina mangrovi]|nr:MAG: Uncharacterised protein [Pseudidiomarina mangrovi]
MGGDANFVIAAAALLRLPWHTTLRTLGFGGNAIAYTFQYVHQLFGFGVLQVNHPSIAFSF